MHVTCPTPLFLPDLIIYLLKSTNCKITHCVFFPSFCYFVSLIFKYPTQHLLSKQSRSKFVPSGEKPSFNTYKKDKFQSYRQAVN